LKATQLRGAGGDHAGLVGDDNHLRGRGRGAWPGGG